MDPETTAAFERIHATIEKVADKGEANSRRIEDKVDQSITALGVVSSVIQNHTEHDDERFEAVNQKVAVLERTASKNAVGVAKLGVVTVGSGSLVAAIIEYFRRST